MTRLNTRRDRTRQATVRPWIRRKFVMNSAGSTSNWSIKRQHI
jgi:hypothetical protein